MEKSEVQDSHTHSHGLHTFESTTLESHFLNEPSHAQLQALKSKGGSGSKGHRRPIRLKADLDNGDLKASMSKKMPDGKVRPRKKGSKPLKRKRPISLKADMEAAKIDVAVHKAQVDRPRKIKKTSRTVKRRRPIALKAELGISESDFPKTNKVQASKTESVTLKSKKVSTKTAPPIEAPVSHGTPDLSQLVSIVKPWILLAKQHRRILLAVSLSFVAGILFQNWFVSDETPTSMPTQHTNTEPLSMRSAPAHVDYATEPTTSSGTGSAGSSLQPYSQDGNYSSTRQLNRGQDYDTTLPSDGASQGSVGRWDDFYEMPQTPSRWRSPSGPSWRDRQERPRPKYNPWSSSDQTYYDDLYPPL